MLLLIDIFSINKGRGYENPSLEIIVTEHCSTGGFPLEEAREHYFLNQSVISVVILISFMCYCGDYASYITVILTFLAFYFGSAYFLYIVYYMSLWEFYFKIFTTSTCPNFRSPEVVLGRPSSRRTGGTRSTTSEVCGWGECENH
jgi:hypothetical protein